MPPKRVVDALDGAAGGGRAVKSREKRKSRRGGGRASRSRKDREASQPTPAAPAAADAAPVDGGAILDLPPIASAAPVDDAAAREAAERAIADLEARASSREEIENARPEVGASLSDSNDLDGKEVAELCEFLLWGAFSLLPKQVGGGALSDREGKMLSKVWAKVLLPYLKGENAALVIALIVTAEVLIKRAFANRALANAKEATVAKG
jgi:hypothetical protein